jgi:hypothetical protein
MPDENDGWGKWAKHLIITLEKLEENQEKIYKRLNDLTVEIAILKTKASFAGAIAGSIVAFVISVITAFILHLVTKG